MNRPFHLPFFSYNLISKVLIFILLYTKPTYNLVAQSSYTQKVYAFKETVSASSSSDKKLTIHHIYVEMPLTAVPIWETAIIGNDSFAVHATIIEQLPVQVGVRKQDKRLVIIKPKPATTIWKLDFDPIAENVHASTDKENSDAVLLIGFFKERKLKYKVLNEVELTNQ